MKIINVLGDKTNLCFLAEHFIKNSINTSMASIRLAFCLCTIKVFKPLPNSKRIDFKVPLCEILLWSDIL
jgi:hypothetical protein